MGYKILILGVCLWVISFFCSSYYKQFMELGCHMVSISFIIILFENKLFHFKDSVEKIMESVEKLAKDITCLKDKIEK